MLEKKISFNILSIVMLLFIVSLHNEVFTSVLKMVKT